MRPVGWVFHGGDLGQLNPGFNICRRKRALKGAHTL